MVAFRLFFIIILVVLTMTDKKDLILKLTIFISKITLRVRFPCTICCAIKTDGTERDISGEGELNNGQAILNLNYTSEIHLPSKKDFSSLQKKFMLLIYLKSSSGRIPAGSVVLPLMRAQSRSIRQMSRIDKCPDKNAFIEFEMKMEKVQEKKDTTLTTTLEKESRLFKNQNSQRNIKIIKSQSRDKIHDVHNSSRILRTSQAQIGILRRMPSKREQIRSSLFENYYSGQSKIGEGEKLFALQREIDSFKTKVMILENEINTKNEKASECEKQMKQLQKKNQQLDLELRSAFSKVQYAERGNKQLTNQIKQLKERAQQEKLNFQNAIKRFQIRQNGYKQQIKVVSQKLYANQNQKQRMVYQKNLSSNEFEGRQKKLREGFKQKEKKLLEERTSMLKKIDSLEKDIQKMKQEISEAKSRNTDSVQQVHELKLNIETTLSQKQRFRNQCNDLRFELTKLKNQKHILEENHDSIGKFNEERRNFRKQLSDKDIENSQYKDKITSIQGQLTRLRNVNQDLDRNLKQKSNNLKILQRDYSILMKENGILKNDICDKQTKITNLIDDLQLEMKRTKFFEGKNVDLQQQFQSKQDKLQCQLRESLSYRTVLQQQIQKLNQELQSSSRQLAQSMKDIHQLQQILQEKKEWISNLESQMIQLNSINQQWQMEKIELAQDKKELQERYNQTIEESQQRETELSAKMFMISQKWDQNAAGLQKSLREAQEKVKMLNHSIRQKDQHLNSLKSQNNQLDDQLEALFKQKEVLISQKDRLNHDNNTLKTSIMLIKKQVSDRDAIIQSLRNTVQQSEKQNDALNKKCQFLRSDLSNAQSLNKIANDQLSKFKQVSYEILDMINSNLKSVDVIMLNIHPDSIFKAKTNLILKLISERNKEIHKNLKEKQHQITQLSLQLEKLIEEKQLKQKGLLEAGQHLEILKRSKTEFSDQLLAKNAIIKELNETIKDKQKQIEQLQATNNKKILGLNSTISEKNRQYAQLKHLYEQLQISFQNMQLQLKNTKIEFKKIQKEKRTLENEHKTKITIADSNLRSEMEKLNVLQADKSFLEKDLRQQRQNLRKVMRELQTKCYQFQDLQMRLQEHDSNSSFKESQLRKIRQSNAELKYLLDIICSFEATNDRQSQFFAKFEKYISEPTSRDNETIKQKAAFFYQNLTTLISIKTDIQQKLRKTMSQLESTSKQHSVRNRNISQLQLKLQELSQTREKQDQSKIALLKAFQQQKVSTDGLRRLLQELLQLLAALQKEKKASVFVISPVKQLVKKIEEKIVLMLKGLNMTISKNKRQWDLANIRAKKNTSKREQVISPPLRP